MTVGVPQGQAPGALDAYRVGQPVATAGGLRLAAGALHAIATVPRHFAGSAFAAGSTPAAQTIVLPFRRVPFCDTAQVTVVLHRSAANTRCYLRAKVGTGAGNGPWVGSNGRMDGASYIYAPSSDMAAPMQTTGTLDVSGVTVGDVGTITVAMAAAVSASSDGIALVIVEQVPRPVALVPESPGTEPGVEPASMLYGAPIVDGSATTAEGWSRMLSQAHRAQQCGTCFWELDWDENGTPNLYCGANTTASYDLQEWPARVMYAVPAAAPSTASTVSVRVWVRYTATLGAAITVNVGATTTTGLTLAPAATPTIATKDISVAVNAYDEWQAVSIEIDTTGGGGTCTVHGFAILDIDGDV